MLSVQLQWAKRRPQIAERMTVMALTHFLLTILTLKKGALRQTGNIMRKLALSLLACGALALTSCSTISTRSGVGVLYTGVTEGEMVTSNTLGTKVGTSSSVGILGLVSIGDASIQTAANSAGIKKVSHVDAKKTSVLGLFAKYELVVYGE